MQCIIQGRWMDDPVVMCLPHVEEYHLPSFDGIPIEFPVLTLPALRETCLKNYEALAKPLRADFDEAEIEKIYKVLYEMPTINVDLSLLGNYLNDVAVNRSIVQPQSRDRWMEVHPGEEYTLNVSLIRLGKRETNQIYCPKFPKGKDEGWFLTLGNQENGELIAMKRIGYRHNKSSHQLTFYTPEKRGRLIYTVYLMSDGYLGFDQQYNVQLEVIQARELIEGGGKDY